MNGINRIFPLDLFSKGNTQTSFDESVINSVNQLIVNTFSKKGFNLKVGSHTVSPTVVRFEFIPKEKVMMMQIRSCEEVLNEALSDYGPVRLIAPIPGKGTIAVEVPRLDRQIVRLREVLESKVFQESEANLPVALGIDSENNMVVADLAKMPHLLIAGATGQGKSVGLNAIIASLLYRKTPDELKFVMIDPKMVEFSLYAKIEAHYLAKIPDAEDAIITDMDKVVATLSSLCVEMDNRYQLLKAAHTRNIEEYNEKIKEKRLNPLEGHRFLPYIVVVVDEFSDLIMTAGKEVEIPIARLAQKARAVGMHVIIATQRPSTNVITGIIKANFPARIAFKVSSGVDSKTILDTPGAQQLIGRGDMLISNNAPMVRVQCAFIDTPEVEAIYDYIERQPYGQGAYELPEPVATGTGESDSEIGNNFGDKDPLFEKIARLTVTSNTASTSSLQQRYSIGYNRAGKIMDQLEAAGIVGPARGGKPRKNSETLNKKVSLIAASKQLKMDIEKRMTVAQLLSRLSRPDLSKEGIEIVVCYLEDEENAIHQINAAKTLKEKGKIVLSIGLLPFSFENKKTILASLKRALLLQCTSDGCMLLNKDVFIDEEHNPEEVGSEIELMIKYYIEQGLQDILKNDTINIDAETLKESLRDCGTFIVTYGDGAGLDRVGVAFRDAYESLLYENFDLNTARTLIIKVLVSKGDTLSNAEQERLRQLISNLPISMNIIFGIGTSDLEANQIQIVMLGTGVDTSLG